MSFERTVDVVSCDIVVRAGDGFVSIARSTAVASECWRSYRRGTA